MIGKLFRVRYEIVAPLSDGPIFTAFQARDQVENRDVTLRLLRSPFNQEFPFIAALRESVEAESEALSRYVETIRIVDEQDGMPFLVGDFTRGQSLTERIKKLAPFSPPVAIGIGITILQGLEELHRHGIVHGDLSPNNITIQPDGSACLQLSGVWRAYGASETAGAVVLPHMAPYLAPEISKGAMPSPASDIYSFGIIMFQLIAGQLPYRAETPFAMALKHATEDAPSLRLQNKSTPYVLDQILKKCLSRDVEHRYSSADELLSHMRMLQDAMRFGRNLSWPIVRKPGATPAPSVAPKMSAIRDRLPKREDDEDGARGDIPPWLTWSIFGSLALLAALIGFYFFTFSFSKPKLVTVPSLRGMSISEARGVLNSLKLSYRIGSHEPNERIPAESVIDGLPTPGLKVREGTQIALKLSSGSKYVETPDLRGRTVDQARELLGALSLDLDSRVDQVQSSDVARGLIVSQIPEPKTKVERGAKIRARVSADVPSSKVNSHAQYIYTLSIHLNDISEPVQLRVEMTDDRGTRVVYNQEQPPDADVEVSAQGVGKSAKFKVFYGDTLVKEFTKDADEDQPGNNPNP